MDVPCHSVRSDGSNDTMGAKYLFSSITLLHQHQSTEFYHYFNHISWTINSLQIILIHTEFIDWKYFFNIGKTLETLDFFLCKIQDNFQE